MHLMYVIDYLYMKKYPSATKILHMYMYTLNNILRKKY